MPGIARPATPINRPANPVAPPPMGVEEEPPHAEPDASGLDSVVTDEDDSVNVPPPPLEYLGNTHHVPNPDAPAIVPRYQNLDYKQTLIPVLLTAGFCMLAIGSSRFVLAPDTVLGNLPLFLVIPLLLFGALALLFGVLTMFQVKHTLDEQAKAAQEAAAMAGAT